MSYSSKQEILEEIRWTKNVLNDKTQLLKRKARSLSDLNECGGKCNSSAQLFGESILRRKNRLKELDSFLSSVNMAGRYKTKMTEMLYGAEYAGAVRQIDNLMKSIANEQNKLKRVIIDLEDEVRYLKNRLQELQYEYNQIVEVEEDGE